MKELVPLAHPEVGAILHDRTDESWEAKARWFQSLSLEDRMRLLCEFTDLVLTVNPDIAKKRIAQSITGRVCVLEEAALPINRSSDTMT